MRLPFCVIDKKLTFATPRVLISLSFMYACTPATYRPVQPGYRCGEYSVSPNDARVHAQDPPQEPPRPQEQVTVAIAAEVDPVQVAAPQVTLSIAGVSLLIARR
jgi:hypothetical protein